MVGYDRIIFVEIFWLKPSPLLCWQVKSQKLSVLCDSGRPTLTSTDFDLRGLQPDSRVETLLRFSSPEDLDRQNGEARKAGRLPELFALYPPADEVSTVVPDSSIKAVRNDLVRWLLFEVNALYP